MKQILVVISALVLIVNASAKFVSNQFSPNGIFDKLFDRFGQLYTLDDVQVRLAQAGGGGGQNCESECVCGYFHFYFEEGCGMEDPINPTHQLRRNVLCQVATDLNAFVVPYNVFNGLPINEVRIWVRDPFQVFDNLGLGNNINSIKAGASSLYTLPGGAYTTSGILDGEVWKTINGMVDSYTDVVPPLVTSGGNDFPLEFYHGLISFNFQGDFNENGSSLDDWHYEMPVEVAANLTDMYTVSLHEMFHLLGFASLMNSDGIFA